MTSAHTYPPYIQHSHSRRYQRGTRREFRYGNHAREERPFRTGGVATLEDADGADEGDGRHEDLLFFLYFAQDAHFRRTTEESGINEYSGATESWTLHWLARDGRERRRGKKIEWSAREEAGGRETHGGGEIEDGREKML